MNFKPLPLCTSAPLRDGHFAQVGKAAHASVLLCVKQNPPNQQRRKLNTLP
ncbi:hypothetical protein [Anabaena sp. CCY 9402-a]|uniref:hypothetical protein n=1 Tax=Anabaena sp. CCY 9402-a TaxID=3103867 RepID=UPI0039C65DC8